MSKHNYSQYSNKPNKPNKSGAVNPDYVPPATTPKVKMEQDAFDEIVTPVEPTVEPITESTITLAQETLSNNKLAMVQETVDTVALPETVVGTVVNCAKLNVRANPSIKAEIVGVLDTMSEIKIDVEKSNNEWFKICTTTGIDGYCMRKFVNAHL